MTNLKQLAEKLSGKIWHDQLTDKDVINAIESALKQVRAEARKEAFEEVKKALKNEEEEYLMLAEYDKAETIARAIVDQINPLTRQKASEDK